MNSASGRKSLNSGTLMTWQQQPAAGCTRPAVAAWRPLTARGRSGRSFRPGGGRRPAGDECRHVLEVALIFRRAWRRKYPGHGCHRLEDERGNVLRAHPYTDGPQILLGDLIAVRAVASRAGLRIDLAASRPVGGMRTFR